MCKEEYLFQLGNSFYSDVELALMDEVEGYVAMPVKTTVYLCGEEPVVLTHVIEGDDCHPIAFRTEDGKHVLFGELSTDDVMAVAQTLSTKYELVNDVLWDYE